MWSWHDEWEAAKLVAQREFAEAAGPCPYCGGPGEVELINVSDIGGPARFVPGEVSCIRRCWETDPDAYLSAVRQLT